jgi:hypothetical protein
MQVCDLSGNEIVCTAELAQSLANAVPGLATLHTDDKVAIVSIGDKYEAAIAYLTKQGHGLSPRFMDRFFIQLSEDDEVRRSIVS